MLTFPTGRRGNGDRRHGTPTRANACQCGDQAMLEPDGACTRCGHWTDTTIRHTWHQRAQTIAQNSRQRKAAA